MMKEIAEVSQGELGKALAEWYAARQALEELRDADRMVRLAQSMKLVRDVSESEGLHEVDELKDRLRCDLEAADGLLLCLIEDAGIAERVEP